MEENIFTRAKQVGIVDVLDRLGARRAGGRGTRLLYHCPFREDRNPSMYVNTDTGRWVDMANPDDIKGDVINLVSRTLNLSPLEAARYILGESAVNVTRPSYNQARMTSGAKSIQYEVKELEHPALIDYLQSRGIPHTLARRWCKEIHIGRYFYIGFQSVAGGYELRNKLDKRSLGPKNISVLGRGNTVIVFEGFIDFLSHLQIYGYLPDTAYVVMNSVSNAEKVISYFASNGLPQRIELWLDNDEAGERTTAVLKESLNTTVIDMSMTYARHADVNDWYLSNCNMD